MLRPGPPLGPPPEVLGCGLRTLVLSCHLCSGGSWLWGLYPHLGTWGGPGSRGSEGLPQERLWLSLCGVYRRRGLGPEGVSTGLMNVLDHSQCALQTHPDLWPSQGLQAGGCLRQNGWMWRTGRQLRTWPGLGDPGHGADSVRSCAHGHWTERGGLGAKRRAGHSQAPRCLHAGPQGAGQHQGEGSAATWVYSKEDARHTDGARMVCGCHRPPT